MIQTEPSTPARPAARRRALGALAAGAAVTVALTGCSLPIGFEPLPVTELTPGAAPEASLAGYYGQEIPWEDCRDGFECAAVYAPVDWENVGGDAITLGLVRHAADSGAPIGSLFVNPGGPGGSGFDFVRDGLGHAVGAELQAQFDVIGWDPRGVGRSTPVDCLSDAEMDEYLFGGAEDVGEPGSPGWIAAATESSIEFGEACQAGAGELLGNVDTVSTVHDLDMLRALVGDEALNYLGYSYGTFIGAHYAEAFPDRVGRLVLDGAIDPAASNFEVVRFQTEGFEQATRAFLADCQAGSSCPFPGSVDDGMARIGALLASVDAEPLENADGRRLAAGTLLTAIIAPLYSQDGWPVLAQMLEQTMAGDPALAFRLADSYYSRDEDGRYLDNSTEAFMAINCLDYEQGADLALMTEQAAELRRVAPTFGPYQGYGDLACANWPEPNTTARGELRAAGAAPILVVGTTGDPATPYRWAVSLAEQLESGVLLSYEGEGHTAYNGPSSCVNGAVERYLLTGQAPASDPKC